LGNVSGKKALEQVIDANALRIVLGPIIEKFRGTPRVELTELIRGFIPHMQSKNKARKNADSREGDAAWSTVATISPENS
jgi:hypothetical protein